MLLAVIVDIVLPVGNHERKEIAVGMLKGNAFAFFIATEICQETRYLGGGAAFLAVAVCVL